MLTLSNHLYLVVQREVSPPSVKQRQAVG